MGISKIIYNCLIILSCCLIIVINIGTMNLALDFINSPSDVGVIIGISLLIASLLIPTIIIYEVINYYLGTK